MRRHFFLTRMDFRVIPVILSLMVVSILVISSTTANFALPEGLHSFWTPKLKSQMNWFLVGWGIFFLFAALDYRRLREWTWPFYILVLLALMGLFLTGPVRNVYRWYQIPFTGVYIQPAELAKIAIVFALSWFLERHEGRARNLTTTLQAMAIVGVPFLLIVLQPDLDAALVLYPVMLVMFYFGDIHPAVTRTMVVLGLLAVVVLALFFLGIISHDAARPYGTKILKPYQYERLNPNTHHQKAAANAIALGGVTGTGWHQGEYIAGGWLPAAHTDSVFAAFGEEFGLIGLVIVIALYYALIYFSFQVTAVARDSFGRMLAAGLSVFITVHMLVNIGMMCGLLPITGVPLLLVTYGGSSVISCMAMLGILQSIYVRRFLF